MAKRRTNGAVTRFAPSPTGAIHLGHAYSALTAYFESQGKAGRFLVRIEDIDPVRSKPEFERAILEDLEWLGLEWDKPVRRQSKHLKDYQAALDHLRANDIEVFFEEERQGGVVNGPRAYFRDPDGTVLEYIDLTGYMGTDGG